MIRFRKVELVNFCQFKGSQELVFPEGDGVVVVYGDNGRGKSNLLNALRWAFTGEVLQRSGQQRQPGDLVNREAKAEDSRAGCKVQILFSADGTEYHLTRRVEVDEGGAVHVRVLLLRGLEHLNAEQAKAELARLLPPETQQFFFFDGELLNQFEGLLHDDEMAGDKLKASIERLLGVPIVKNAAADCRLAADDATEKLEAAAKKDKDHAEAGRSLEQARTLRVAAEQSVATESQHIERLEKELEGLTETLGQHERTMETIGEIRAQRENLKDLRQRLEEDRGALGLVLPRAWSAVLTGVIGDRLLVAETALESALNQRNRAAFATELRDAVASNDGRCSACGTTPLDETHRAHLADMTAEAQQLAELDERVAAVRAERDLLRATYDTEARVAIVEAEKRVNSRRVECVDLERKIGELEAALGEVNTADLTELIKRRQELSRAIEEAKVKRSEAADNAAGLLNTEAGLRRKLQQFSESNLPSHVRHQDDLGRRLSNLFTGAVEEYRETLLRNVEGAASRLFVEMRSEEDFKGLRINHRYGLEILDPNGVAVGGRSAGYEHLVALSLIGGLQACSTISGPVVMDSPFGRLDPTHVQRVTENLERLSPQVILLVHEREVDPEEAAELLHGHLLAEYRLARVGLDSTEILKERA